MTGRQCPAVRGSGVRCGYVEHPAIRTYVDLSSGWPQPWIETDKQWTNVDLNLGDILRDSPQELGGQGK